MITHFIFSSSSSQFRDKKVASKEDVKWLLGVPEELDIVTAERLFDKAVDIVVRLRTLIQVILPLLLYNFLIISFSLPSYGEILKRLIRNFPI